MGIVSGGGSEFNGGTITNPLLINGAGADVLGSVEVFKLVQPSWGDQTLLDAQITKDGASNANMSLTLAPQRTGKTQLDLSESTHDGDILFDTNQTSSVMPRTGFVGDVFAIGVGGVAVSKVRHDAGLVLLLHAAPADASLAAGECALWFDQTNGAGNTKLMVKGKSADGTVKTATILLA